MALALSSRWGLSGEARLSGEEGEWVRTPFPVFPGDTLPSLGVTQLGLPAGIVSGWKTEG